MIDSNLLDAVGLSRLIDVTNGDPGINIGLIDGPVDVSDPMLAASDVTSLCVPSKCSKQDASESSVHATSLAAALVGRDDDGAVAVCYGYPLITRPIFGEAQGASQSARPSTLTHAIAETVGAGALIINLSVSVSHLGERERDDLTDVLNYACSRGCIVVAASGNAGEVGSSALTSHPWVIPVVAYGNHERLYGYSNLGRNIGMNGLGAPASVYLYPSSRSQDKTLIGTSASAIYVTATAALLRSKFPKAKAEAIIRALRGDGKRRSVVPPLLDAWKSYLFLVEH